MTVTTLVTSPVPPVLDRARVLVTPVEREAVSRLHPSIRLAAEYHLGWCEADGQPVAGDGGKCIRPALAVLSAEAVGAGAGISLPGAAAVELVHNFSLLHDDVIDADRERRHRPTVWAIFGIGSAIIVGDALHALAHQLLLEVPGRAGEGAGRALSLATSRMIAGQAEDVAFETGTGVTVERYMEMVDGKTGAILACAASIGAILASGPDPTVSALYQFGVNLGRSFQAVDDLLGIWGDPSRTGKPIAGDLRQHKQTLPVLAALADPCEHREELERLLGAVTLSDAELARTAELLDLCGGRAETVETARRHLEAALACLDIPELYPAAVSELTDLARFVTQREV